MATLMKVAAVLLMAFLSSQSVDANCLTGIKGLFCNRDGKNYGILADHLYKTTQSTELADNTMAAESLLLEHPDADEPLIELVNMFKSLKGDQSDPESMCSRDNLANMLHVAEAMRAGGNLGPKKITVPILRLNIIIVKFIAHAQPICQTHLDAKWPDQWEPSFSNKYMKSYVKEIWRVPNSFLYKGYMGKPDDPVFDRYDWGSRLSSALEHDALSDRYARRKLDPDCRDQFDTTNKTVLALQLQEYVYKPCKEFVTLKEAHDVLEPYNDLLISYRLIQRGMMKYFRNQEVPRIPWVRSYEIDEAVEKLARGYRACQRLLPMPEKDVLHQVRESRKQDLRSV